jgi:ankyrin repeat protein
LPRLAELVAAGTDPAQISEPLWQACHGGQRRAAEYLLRHGADINTVVPYAHGTALDVAAGADTRHNVLVTWLREQAQRSGP